MKLEITLNEKFEIMRKFSSIMLLIFIVTFALFTFVLLMFLLFLFGCITFNNIILVVEFGNFLILLVIILGIILFCSFIPGIIISEYSDKLFDKNKLYFYRLNLEECRKGIKDLEKKIIELENENNSS